MALPVPLAGTSASLRVRGIGRYFGAVFLIAWLAGWVVGEVMAILFLLALVRSVFGSVVNLPWPVPGGEWIAGGAAGFAFLFLVVWLSLWTVGGFAAITHLLRSLAGEDLVTVRAADLELVRRAGPFRRVRRFEQSDIRRVRIRHHDKAVVVDTTSGTEAITNYGSLTERRDLAEWLRAQLALSRDGTPIDPLTAPPGWILKIDGGIAALTRLDPKTRRRAAIIAWTIASFAALIWYGSLATGSFAGSSVAFLLTLACSWLAAWVTWSLREWQARRGELTWHKHFALWNSKRSFTNARLQLSSSVDSDNDTHYQLTVVDERGKKRIVSELNDHADVVALGRWLEARTGFPLSLPSNLH